MPATHDKCEGKHGPWEVFDRYLNDNEVRLFATIVLSERVDEGKDQSRREDIGA